jgi:hypothetical protein
LSHVVETIAQRLDSIHPDDIMFLSLPDGAQTGYKSRSQFPLVRRKIIIAQSPEFRNYSRNVFSDKFVDLKTSASNIDDIDATIKTICINMVAGGKPVDVSINYLFGHCFEQKIESVEI